MYGFLLLIPFLLIRFLLLKSVNKEAVQRAAYFAPMQGNEKIAYLVYQISNIAFFLYVCFLPLHLNLSWSFYIGLVFSILGLALCAKSIVDFAKPSIKGMNQNGVYNYSRNPMYLSYFIYFLGCVFLTQSWLLLTILIIFQISSHWIILAEERWCIEQFGESYLQYMKQIRRYI